MPVPRYGPRFRWVRRNKRLKPDQKDVSVCTEMFPKTNPPLRVEVGATKTIPSHWGGGIFDRWVNLERQGVSCVFGLTIGGAAESLRMMEARSFMQMHVSY